MQRQTHLGNFRDQSLVLGPLPFSPLGQTLFSFVKNIVYAKHLLTDSTSTELGANAVATDCHLVISFPSVSRSPYANDLIQYFQATNLPSTLVESSRKLGLSYTKEMSYSPYSVITSVTFLYS